MIYYIIGIRRSGLHAIANWLFPMTGEFIYLNNYELGKLTDIETDRPGRSFDRRGPGRHALARERDSKDSATAHFAKDIVEELESLLGSSETKRYLLIAAPSMLGVLRHKLEHSGVSEPYRSLDKDIVDQSLESVREVVLKYQLNQQGIGETL